MCAHGCGEHGEKVWTGEEMYHVVWFLIYLDALCQQSRDGLQCRIGNFYGAGMLMEQFFSQEIFLALSLAAFWYIYVSVYFLN